MAPFKKPEWTLTPCSSPFCGLTIVETSCGSHQDNPDAILEDAYEKLERISKLMVCIHDPVDFRRAAPNSDDERWKIFGSRSTDDLDEFRGLRSTVH